MPEGRAALSKCGGVRLNPQRGCILAATGLPPGVARPLGQARWGCRRFGSWRNPFAIGQQWRGQAPGKGQPWRERWGGRAFTLTELTRIGPTRLHFLLCARRLASSKRLVVLAGVSALGRSASLGAASGSRAAAMVVSAPGKVIVTGRSVRNKSGLGSCAGPVRVERTASRRASNAAKDSSASTGRGAGRKSSKRRFGSPAAICRDQSEYAVRRRPG
jgi:hypothetical protein